VADNALGAVPYTGSVPLAVAAAFVLGKQGLAGALPEDGDVAAAVQAAAGVYATAPTCYLSCAARLPGSPIEAFDAAAHGERSLVLLRAMRGSAYAVPLDVLPAVVGATGAPVVTATARLVRAAGLLDADYAGLADRIEDALVGRRPATVPEIRALLGDAVPPRREALQYAVALMAAEARLVRAERRGGWRSDSYGYARWADCFAAPLRPVEPAAARVALARWYLAAFGPATREDLRWWAGWPARDATAALHGLASELARVELVDPAGAPAEGYLLADELPALRSTDPVAAHGIRLLPVWDAYLMGYADRRRLLAEPDRPWVYDKSGNATSVVLVNGVVTGVWEHTGGPGEAFTVRVAPLAEPDRPWWAGVEAAAEALAEAVGAARLEFDRVPKPGPLADGARNAFLAPIRLAAPG
jgi:hypothetical protein